MKIVIGTITRNRPQMLGKLLASYAAMEKPKDAELSFVIVENNDALTMGPVVDKHRDALQPWDVALRLEPRPGIPFARNHVLDFALAKGADYLSFIDDDEEVDEKWLMSLLAHSLAKDLDLVGGPVLMQQMPDCAGWLQKMVWRGLAKRNTHVARKLQKRVVAKGSNSVNISTANWLAKLDFFRQTSLRFDEGIGTGSGEDRKLYKTLVRLGGNSGWTMAAKVYDNVPLSRLTLSYQFKRGRDHTAFLFVDPMLVGRPTRLVLFAKALGRIPRIALAILAMPLTLGTSVVMAARLAGDMVGFIDAIFGRHSSHYTNVTGD